MEELLTPQEVAEKLKVPRKTVYTWLNQGKLKGHKIGDLWRVKESDLEEFIRDPFDESENID